MKQYFMGQFLYTNMKITIDLPEALIEEAMRITGSKSKIDTI
jgi:hypothetical protein